MVVSPLLALAHRASSTLPTSNAPPTAGPFGPPTPTPRTVPTITPDNQAHHNADTLLLLGHGFVLALERALALATFAAAEDLRQRLLPTMPAPLALGFKPTAANCWPFDVQLVIVPKQKPPTAGLGTLTDGCGGASPHLNLPHLDLLVLHSHLLLLLFLRIINIAPAAPKLPLLLDTHRFRDLLDDAQHKANAPPTAGGRDACGQRQGLCQWMKTCRDACGQRQGLRQRLEACRPACGQRQGLC